jgi:hypothetical protein
MPDDVTDKLQRLYWKAAEGKLTARERAALEALAEDGPDRADVVKAKAAAMIADRFPQAAS